MLSFLRMLLQDLFEQLDQFFDIRIHVVAVVHHPPPPLVCAASSNCSRYACASSAASHPSPQAETSCFTAPERTSPAAKTPATEVSSRRQSQTGIGTACPFPRSEGRESR